MNIFKTDAGHELVVAESFDRDDELALDVEVQDGCYTLDLSKADIKRLRSILSIALGE